jgi:RNA polymerase sigma-70 factor (ECF subfamily)
MAHTPSPALQENENESLDKMYLAIEGLNEIEKSIVLLYLDAYSYEEMEEILGISSGALRVKNVLQQTKDE